MGKLKLLIGIHCHQPVGNFGHVFKECFEKSYLPFIQVLEKYPSVKVSLHYSGPLIDWIEENQPSFFSTIKKMVKKGQVEMLGGGYYEPILSSIPEEDAVGQIEMMSAFIEKKFGTKPKGLWLTERIWDPYIPKILNKANINYTLLDDTHFYYAGLTPEKMFNYYITEKHGAPLNVFPIHKFLRYSMPFMETGETTKFLRETWEKDNNAAVTFGDDGEKFGVWPGTHKWVYEEKWLENFFDELESNSDWLETQTFSQYIEGNKPKERIYLPMASYEEMMEWSLPADVSEQYINAVHDIEHQGKKEAYLPFLRGGLWDNFFAKYDESNNMHKKMLHVSERVDRVKPLNNDAYKALYKGQCNCAYWHGLFGGLYLNYLRDGLYRNLIEAENILDAEEFNGKDFLTVEKKDFNKDGSEEILISNRYINAFFSSKEGGSMFLFDYKRRSFCLSNVIARKKEAYHKKIFEAEAEQGGESPKSIHDIVKFKEEGLQEFLHYDDSPKYSFMDKIYSGEITFNDYCENKVQPIIDLSNCQYREDITLDKKKEKVALSMQRLFHVKDCSDDGLEIQKDFEIDKKSSELKITYSLINNSAFAAKVRFGYDVVLTLLAPDAPDRYIKAGRYKGKPNNRKEIVKTKSFSFVDEWSNFQVQSSFSIPMDVWITPIETVSQSEDGFERNYQGTVFFINSVLNLTPGMHFKCVHTLICKGP
ncbi:MAG: DUF1926 domain-containing protein [Nitrospinae bacterium]|nr:DUF1926 domain-containing protein [Nitrospinota bacterium]